MKALLPGFKLATETRERAALTSLEYGGVFNSGKDIIDAGLTHILSAMQTGDRAEAWYSLRYELNPNMVSAAAREHFDEAQVFGLYMASNPQSSADITQAEALLALRMATAHENTIANYDSVFASQITSAQSDVSLLELRTKSDYGTVTTTHAALTPAVDHVVYDFTDLNHLASDLKADLASIDSALNSLTFNAVWVAANANSDQGAAHTVDRGDHGSADDLIFGSIANNGVSSSSNDALHGGSGDDFIVGGKGADVIDGGFGEDTVSYLTSTSGVKLNLSQGLGTAGDAKGDTFSSVENVLGTAFADKIIGDANNNILYGGGGADQLVGGQGADFLIGGSGADTIFGDGLGESDIKLNPVAMRDLTHGGDSLVGRLGGEAGFGENVLASSDDGSTGAIDITSVFGEEGLNFFGNSYTNIYINNNGNITFNGALSAYTPGDITAGFGNPIIAAFWADVDTRGAEGLSDHVYYDLDASHGVLTITWDEVGYYSQHFSPSNSFQMQLIDEHNGNFDIVFRYTDINWTTGDASNGVIARAGYAAGNDTDYYELSQSGDDTAMRDLPTTEGNTGIDGLFVFHVINGQVFGAGDTIDGGAGADVLTGGPGADLFIFHAGEANGDVVKDFNEVSGDRLQFIGYGEDATFTKIDATHWQIGDETITFSNAPIITPGDYVFS
jgi:Ca2+-binding RTX toxin-like protein